MFSQNYSVRHLTTRDGLAAEEVAGFVQDDKGFIWITGIGGLQRFDGKNFITYRHEDKDTTSLSYDDIVYPVIDKENNLWLKNPDSYINIFNISNGKVKRVIAADDKPGHAGDDFVLYCRDAKGTMWLCRSTALYRYNYTKANAEKIAAFPDSVVSVFLDPMICDSVTGKIWISTKSGLMQYDPGKNIFYHSRFNPANIPVLSRRSEPIKILIDRQRNLWYSTWDNQLFRYNLDTHSFKQFHIPVILSDGTADKENDRVKGLIQDSYNNIWIGTDKGSVFKYDMLLDTFNVVVAQLYEKAYSNNTGIEEMFTDREGNIWVGTDFGIYIFNPAKQKIFSIENNPYRNLTFPAREVITFHETGDGQIWVSSFGGGVSVFDNQMHLVNRMFYRNKVDNERMTRNSIWSFCEDRYGKLWMAGYTILASYDIMTKKLFFLEAPEMNFTVHAIKNDDNGNLWIGGSDILIRFNPLSKQFKVFSNLSAPFKNNGAEIKEILIDKYKNFWVGTRYGLFRFDTKVGKYVEHFTHNNGRKPNSEDEIICISEYNDSTLLLGTTNGLGFFDVNKKKFMSLKFNASSISKLVRGVNRDQEGNIFAATGDGLYQIDTGLYNSRHYDYEDGILDNQFYTKIYKLRDGRMLTGGLNSFIYFDPEDLKQTFTPPDVQVTGFKIFDKQYPADLLLDSSGTIHLDFDQNFIVIQYASLYYNAPARIHYYYRLSGVDKNWVNAGNARSATYTDLNNGNYTFEVKCVNDDGVTSKNVTSFHISIATPYYKSWWFILLCAVILATIFYAAYDYRLRNQKNLSEIRRRIAFDLHDDIGSTLNSISVYSEVARQQLQSNTEQAKTILEKMGNASRSMIDNMNDIVWAINPKNDDFENILQRMQYFAGELLSAKNILLQFDVNENIKRIKLPMEKRKNFYLIYKEAINNAYKYAESKNVAVSISEKDGNLFMVISDDGKGFNMVEKSLGGNGLVSMKARAEAIGANIEVNSFPGQGTSVLLKMKF